MDPDNEMPQVEIVELPTPLPPSETQVGRCRLTLSNPR